MTTRTEAIAAHIAKRIAANTRKRFSTLHAEALEETQMSQVKHSPTTSCTTTGMQVHDTRDNRIATQAAAEANAAAQGKKFVANPELSPMGEAAQPVVGPIKPVDFKTITGSYAGDHRAGAAPAVLPNQPSPREQMEGQRDSRNYNENGKAFKSTGNSPDSDAGN